MRQEVEFDNPQTVATSMTQDEAMDRYAREVSSRKHGAREETVRIDRLRRDKIAGRKLTEIGPGDFADGRDPRPEEVKGSTERREMEQYSGVQNHCVKVWAFLTTSPLRTVKRPSDGKSRDRMPTRHEIERLRFAAGGVGPRRNLSMIGRTFDRALKNPF